MAGDNELCTICHANLMCKRIFNKPEKDIFLVDLWKLGSRFCVFYVM